MPIIDPSSSIPSPQLPTKNPPKRSKKSLLLLSNILVFIFSTCHILVVILSACLLALVLFFKEEKMDFDQNIPIEEKMSLDQNIAIQKWPKYTVPARNLKADKFSTEACLSLVNPSHVSREPLDLVFVVDIPRARDPRNMEVIQNSINDALPFFGDKDRLSTIIVDQNNPMGLYVPLTHTTRENKNGIFSCFGRDFPVKDQGLKIAINFLNERRDMNSVTGIMVHTQKCDQNEINKILQDLKSLHAFVLCSESGGFFLPFQTNMQELQDSIIGNVELFVKPENSTLFRGVEIFKQEFKEYEDYAKTSNRMFIGKNINLLFPLRQECFAVDIKTLYPTPHGLALLIKSTRVKIASFETIFTSVSGQKVIKNQDYSIGVERSSSEIKEILEKQQICINE